MGPGSHNWHIDGLCNVTWHDNKKWIKYELIAIIWCERKHNILKSIFIWGLCWKHHSNWKPWFPLQSLEWSHKIFVAIKK
jgi:hypothetical protein